MPFLDVTPCSLVDRFRGNQHVPACFSETFVHIFQTTRRQISGNVDYNIHSRVNPKSHRPGADEKGAASTNYRGPAVRKGAPDPTVLLMFLSFLVVSYVIRQ